MGTKVPVLTPSIANTDQPNSRENFCRQFTTDIVLYRVLSRHFTYYIYYKQTAPLHFMGQLMVFNKISKAAEVSISIEKCPRNALELNICTKYFRK